MTYFHSPRQVHITVGAGHGSAPRKTTFLAIQWLFMSIQQELYMHGEVSLLDTRVLSHLTLVHTPLCGVALTTPPTTILQPQINTWGQLRGAGGRLL